MQRTQDLQRVLDPVITEGKEVELVTSTKLLGLTIANDLIWNDHVTEITKKASKRLYFLTQLKRAGVPKQDLALFYVSCVRSVIDYAAPVFFNGLPQYLKKELVRLEKRAISIITSGKCNSAIEVGLTPILEHYYVLRSRQRRYVLYGNQWNLDRENKQQQLSGPIN